MSKVHKTKPIADGFYMPGEHEPHEEMWIAWPERPDNWPETHRALASIEKAADGREG